MPQPFIVIDESRELDEELTQNFPEGTEVAVCDFGSGWQKTREFMNTPWAESTISVDSTGMASFPNGCLKQGKENFNQAQENALAKSYNYTLRNLEKVTGKDMKGSDHLVIIRIQELEPPASATSSGPWDYDRYRKDFPLTTMVYFNHLNIHSKLALFSLKKNNNLIETIPLYMLNTYPGSIITFNNQAVQSCVYNVSSIDHSKPSHRFLLTFFYKGPAGVPKLLKPINAMEQVVDLRAIKAADSTFGLKQSSDPQIDSKAQGATNSEIPYHDVYMNRQAQQKGISSYLMLKTCSTIALLAGASALIVSALCVFCATATALTGGAAIATAVVGAVATLAGAAGLGFFSKKSRLESTLPRPEFPHFFRDDGYLNFN